MNTKGLLFFMYIFTILAFRFSENMLISIKDISKSITSNSKFSYTEFNDFWNHLKRSKYDATKFITELINKLVEIEKTQKKLIKLDKNINHMVCLIKNTISFVELFYPIDFKSQNLDRAIRSYLSNRSDNRSNYTLENEVHRIIKNLHRKYIEGSKLTSEIAIDCAYVNSVESSLITSSRSSNLMLDFGFLHLRVQETLLNGGSASRELLHEILRLLNSMPSQLNAQPNLASLTVGNVLACIFFNSLLYLQLFSFPYFKRSIIFYPST